MANPIAVLISDIHFTVNTLELASKALTMSIDKAKSLSVPLIIAGDTLDSKAIIRAECANRLIEIFEKNTNDFPIYLMVGNHDLLNEKGYDNSLEFLSPYVFLVKYPVDMPTTPISMIPYQTNKDRFTTHLINCPEGNIVICHQGLQSAWMGHYIQDKTSLPKETFADFRTISGHYHRRQDINCGRPRKGAVGLFSYIGSPFTQSFGEASDPEKGFQILMSDGTLQFVPTNLRKHVIMEYNLITGAFVQPAAILNRDDLIWLKVRGTKLQLRRFDKKQFGQNCFKQDNYKLDLIETDNDTQAQKQPHATAEEMLDKIIDGVKEDPEFRAYLKTLWREVVSENPKS